MGVNRKTCIFNIVESCCTIWKMTFNWRFAFFVYFWLKITNLYNTSLKKKLHFSFCVIFVHEKQIMGWGKMFSLSTEPSPTWWPFWQFWRQKRYLIFRSFETLVALGNELSENSQETWRLIWRGHFLPSAKPYKWHPDWLKAVLRSL